MANVLTVNLWNRIIEWYRGTVLYELIGYYVQTFFTIRPVEYEHIKLTASGAATLRNAVLAMALGVIFAAFGIFYTRRYPGGLVRALLRSEATSPEKALTLAELGYFYSIGIRLDLKRGGVLTRTVVRVGDAEPPVPLELREEEPTEQEITTEPEPQPAEEPTAVVDTSVRKQFDFAADRFYIPEALRYRAELRYTQKGSGILPLVLTILLTVVASGLLCRYLPGILSLVDRLI